MKKAEKKPRSRAGYGLLSGIIGIFLNVLLFVVKLVVGLFIGSVAVMADAFNNLTDAAGSVVTIVGFKVAAKPADTEHPFGHGRMEEIAGLIISMVMVFIGFEFARTSIMNIFNPEPLYFSWVAVGILVFGFFVKLWMYIFNNRLGKKISSNALIAVAKDARIDCVISAFTVAAIFLAHFLGIYADGYAGLLVSLFILYQGYSSAKESVSALIGKPAEPEITSAIEALALSHEGVLGVHDLAVHNYGAQKNIATIHIEVDKNTPLTECFAISKSIEAKVFADLGVDITIHFDPI
ncbi:MAG: cation diffusion facilitator family transporter [Defluviitaleaceae bacterium]|nr:cation diffusion facilitator family transporter [Defluviitaleaceae bacterium]